MRQNLRNLLATGLLGLGLVACGGDGQTGPGALLSAENCALAVIGSDYSSTSVSLLDEAGDLCAQNFLHSGSAAPGLVTAFSGDVVLPNHIHPEGLLTLVDRYPNSVISLIDVVAGEMRMQFSVGEGFAANPQDILFWSSNRAYITRHEANPTPSADLQDFDEGDDVVIVNPQEGTLLGRIDLGAFVPEGEGEESFWARPGRMARLGPMAWVPLRVLSADYQRGGHGVLLAVHSANDTVVESLELPGAKNCGGLSVAGEHGFWGVCTGIFHEGLEQQVQDSEIFYVDGEEEGGTLAVRVEAESLQGRALSFEIEALDENRVAYIALGDLGTGTPDEIFLYDRRTESSMALDIEAPAFQLGGLHWRHGQDLLLVANADPTAPALLRLTLEDQGDRVYLPSVDPSPVVGLPPRLVGSFR